MASKGAPKQDGIVGVIALAVSQSKLKGLAGRSTLKSVIAGQYQDLVKDGTIRLQVLWNLLKDLPGFDKEDAKAAFCAIKSWESDFVLKVELPEELADMSDSEQSRAAGLCMVSANQKAQALFPSTMAETTRMTPAGGSPLNPTSRLPRDKVVESGSSTKRLISVLVIAVLAVGGFTAYKTFSGNDNAVALSSIAGDLPIKSATRKGATLDLRLTTQDWFSSPDAGRKRALEATLRSVAAIKIDTVMVYDSVGNYRASARWFGSPPVIAVRLKK